MDTFAARIMPVAASCLSFIRHYADGTGYVCAAVKAGRCVRYASAICYTPLPAPCRHATTIHTPRIYARTPPAYRHPLQRWARARAALRNATLLCYVDAGVVRQADSGTHARAVTRRRAKSGAVYARKSMPWYGIYRQLLSRSKDSLSATYAPARRRRAPSGGDTPRRLRHTLRLPLLLLLLPRAAAARHHYRAATAHYCFCRHDAVTACYCFRHERRARAERAPRQKHTLMPPRTTSSETFVATPMPPVAHVLCAPPHMR